jgi:ATP-dependent Clp protease adaptor protein ClpS
MSFFCNERVSKRRQEQNARMSTQHFENFELDALETKLKPPPFYKVILLNDDFTPMDFVVIVLQQFFALDRERATQVMLQVHKLGRGICGIYAKDVAATKVQQVTDFARQHQHPLQCVMEES